MFNLCADGETLLSSQVVEYIRAILEQGHFVMVVTNGTMTKRFDEIIKFPAHLLSHLFLNSHIIIGIEEARFNRTVFLKY